MAKCNIDVVLSEPEPTVRPGDTIEGTAIVHLDKAVTCNRFTISCFWRTHGRGNRTEGEPQIETPFSGDWLGDRSYEYPFEFVVPEGPATYHGDLLNIDWYVKAHADIPWAMDPKGEAEFRMLPGEPVDRPSEPHAEYDDGTPKPFKLRRGTVPGWAGCLVGIPVLAVFIGGGLGVLPFDVEPFGLFCLTAVTMLVCGGGMLVLLALRNKMAMKKIGGVNLSVSKTALRAGDEIDVEIRFSPKEELDLRDVTAKLVCFERVVSGSGTNQTTHTKDVLKEEIVLHTGGRIRPPEGVDARGTLTVPADAPPSFQAPANAIVWTLDVNVDIPRWPDWRRHVDLTILP